MKSSSLKLRSLQAKHGHRDGLSRSQTVTETKVLKGFPVVTQAVYTTDELFRSSASDIREREKLAT